MTIREELKMLGPERVRAAMRSFEGGCDGCFLHHAFKPEGKGSYESLLNRGRIFLGIADPTHDAPEVERAFEGWVNGNSVSPEHTATSRAELRAECIAFLAEHGNATELAPTSRENAVAVGCGMASSREPGNE